MRTVIGIIVVIGLQGCIPNPPAWVTGEARDAWIQTRNLAILPPQQGEEGTDDIDIFTSWYSGASMQGGPIHFTGVSRRAIRDLLLIDAGLSRYETANAECADRLSQYWIIRPSWYFPTRSEVHTTAECVVNALCWLARIERPEEGDLEFANAIGEIGQAVYSERTHRVLTSPEVAVVAIDDSFIVHFGNYMESPILRRLVDDAIRHPAFKRATSAINSEKRSIDHILESVQVSDPTDSALLHANDFLDHEGHTIASLEVWRQTFMRSRATMTTRLRKLAHLISVKPDVVENAVGANEKRFTVYRRGMGAAWSSWNECTGSLLGHLWLNTNPAGQAALQTCIPTEAHIQVSTDTIREIFDYLDSNRSAASRFGFCISSLVISGRVEIPKDEHLPNMVASLLHLVKTTSDPLALIALSEQH